MDVQIVDITLRAYEQITSKVVKANHKIRVAKLLDSIGIKRIEAGIPAMGADARKSIAKLAAEGLSCKISSWNRLNLDDIRASTECGADIIHISVPASDAQIARKLDKTKEWVLEHLKKCVCECREKGFEVTVGLEDAAGADRDFLYALIDCAVAEGVEVIRYADTGGHLLRSRTYSELRAIKDKYNVEIEMHAHNEFGMAVANSVAAVRAGAGLVSCSAGGLGFGAGNCRMYDFVKAAGLFLGACRDYDLERVKEAEREILALIRQ